MNFFKEFFQNTTHLLNVLNTFDYSKLILVFLIISFIGFIHIFYITYKYKKRINKSLIELKRFNLEATLDNKRRSLAYIYLSGFFFVSFLIIAKDSLDIVLPVFSALIIISIISLKEQLNNIFLGLLFKSSISTTIHQDMMFYFKEEPNEICKISKVNLFKTIYKNERTGKLHSIENKHLNETHITHKAIKDLDYVEFIYILNTNNNIEAYVNHLKELVSEYIKTIPIDYKNLKDNVYLLKNKYNSAPYLKPFYNINLKYKNKDELEVLLTLTTYNYDYDFYSDDFLKYSPLLFKNFNNVGALD